MIFIVWLGSRQFDGIGSKNAGGIAVCFKNCESLHDKLDRKNGRLEHFHLAHTNEEVGMDFVCLILLHRCWDDGNCGFKYYFYCCLFFKKPILLKIQMCYLCNIKKLISCGKTVFIIILFEYLMC